MTFEDLRAYCAKKKGVTYDTPFGPDVMVFRVMQKMFALAPIDVFDTVNLKCDPERAIELREQYPGITPGYHMSKVHWNTVSVTSDVPHKLLLELIDHSYDLVRASLPRNVRAELED